MARNILLTSLSSSENEYPVRYFSAKKEFGYEYCDAILSVEASTKYVLAHFDINEIIVIGRKSTFDENDDGRLIALQEGSSFYSADIHNLSAYSLYRYRIAQYIDELTIEQQEIMELLTEEEQDEVTGFIRDFFKNETGGKEVRKANRYFDTLANDKALYKRFCNGLPDAVPGAKEDPRRYMQWTKAYLFRTLKDTGKLELLPINEDVYVRFIPTRISQNGGEQLDTLALVQAIVGNDREINLYVSLHSEDASDSFVVMNMLEIMNSMPGHPVTVRKVFTVESTNELVGEIHDDTTGFGISELVAANRTFLSYGKADMIVDLWEKSGERNDAITSMVYAMRHIDVGLSMCNISEVEDGIVRLRELLKGNHLNDAIGPYSRMFHLVAEGVVRDYGPLLEDDEISFLELVKWAYRHHFYQQTLTLIESRAPVNLINTGIFYYCDDENEKAQVTKVLALQRLELKSYEYYKMDDIDYYFVKTYDRGRNKGKGDRNADLQETYAALRMESLTNTDPDLITGHTACDNTETLQNLLYAYYHLGVVRNKLNHASDKDMEDKRLIVAENDMSYALLYLKESIDYFIACYEKALEEVKGKTPNIVKITSQDVRVCAEQLRQDTRLREKTKGKETDDETAAEINSEANSEANAERDAGIKTKTKKNPETGSRARKDTRTDHGSNTDCTKKVKTGTDTENETDTEKGTEKKDRSGKNVRRRRRRKKKPGTGNEAS